MSLDTPVAGAGGNGGVVAQVVPYAGQVGTDREAKLGEVLAGTDARTHEQAWTAVHPAVSVDTGYRGVQRQGALLHTRATFASPLAVDGDGPDLTLWSSDPEGDPAEGWLDVVLLRPEGRGRVQLRLAEPGTAAANMVAHAD